MQEFAIAGNRFDGVAKCMSVIQHCPQTSFFMLILGDNLSLELTGATNEMSQHFVIAGNDFGDVPFQIVEEVRIEDYPIFSDLGQTAAKFSFG